MNDYEKIPKYIMHADENTIDVPTADEDNNATEMQTNADGFTLGGVQYYDKEKVEALIAAALQEAKSYADTQDEAVKAWASGQFQPKV